MVAFSSEHRAASGLQGGDPIEVEIVLDDQPRLFEIPEDLAQALEDASLQGVFDKLAPSHKKEHIRAINEAKTAETRARRIIKVIDKLAAR